MVIRLSEITDERLKVKLDEHISIEDTSVKGRIVANLSLEKIKKEVIVSGEVEFFPLLICNRCLAEFNKDLKILVNINYHSFKNLSIAEKVQLKSDELESGFLEGDEIDLSQLVKEQAILNLPMKILCNEDCKGLCPQCGKNLNYGKCKCKREEVDERLKKLEKLLK